MIRPVLLSLLVLGLAQQPALAQDTPPLAPTRDVSVTYKMVGMAAGQTMQMSWSVAGGLMRVDTPGGHGFMIIDRAKQRGMMVMTQQKMYAELDSGLVGPPGALPDANAKFTRGGTETIAGLSCTVWTYVAPTGTGTACMTTDGVMLRASTKEGMGLEATKVAFETQPADRFRPPADFQKMDMAAMGAARPKPPRP